VPPRHLTTVHNSTGSFPEKGLFLNPRMLIYSDKRN
jgi:hypothetical protein